MFKTKQRKKKICEKPASEAASEIVSKAFGTGGLSSLMRQLQKVRAKCPLSFKALPFPRHISITEQGTAKSDREQESELQLKMSQD